MHRKRFISNSMASVVSSLFAQVISLITLPLFIDRLGLDLYGVFVISTMMLGYVGIFDFGLTQGIVRTIGKSYARGDIKQSRQATSTGFLILILAGILSFTVLFYSRDALVGILQISSQNQQACRDLLEVTAWVSLISWPARLPGCILQGTLNIKYNSIADSVGAVFSSSILLFMVISGADLAALRWGGSLAMIATCIPKLFAVIRNAPEFMVPSRLLSFDEMRDSASYSLGVFYSQLLSMLGVRIDHLLIGGFLGGASVGLYSVAQRPFELLSNFTARFLSALTPTVYALDGNNDRARLQKLLDRVVFYRTFMVCPIACLGVVFFKPFVGLWVGEEFSEVVIWGQLLLTCLLLSVFGPITHVVRGLGKMRAVNFVFTVRVLVNLGVGLSLIRHLGIGGPVLGTLAATVLLGDFLFYAVFCKMIGLQWRKTYFQTIRMILVSVFLSVPFYLSVNHWLVPTTWMAFFVQGLIVVVLWMLPFAFAFLKRSEYEDLELAFASVGVARLSFLTKIFSFLKQRT